MLLQNYSDESLLSELERRKQAKLTLGRPSMLYAIDTTILRQSCADYLTECERGLATDSDTKHYIFEAAMEMLYGKDVWKYINALNK